MQEVYVMELDKDFEDFLDKFENIGVVRYCECGSSLHGYDLTVKTCFMCWSEGFTKGD